MGTDQSDRDKSTLPLHLQALSRAVWTLVGVQEGLETVFFLGCRELTAHIGLQVCPPSEVNG